MKRFYGYFILFAVLTIIAVQSSPVFAASNLEEGIKELAQQISKNMTETGKKKIAIVEFSDLDGNITAFGQFLAEELITKLFMISPGQFEVVERRQLMKVLKEQRLTMSGLFDAKAMESVGKILGIDAIVTGSITDLGNTVKVNARLIGVDTAKVFAVAATSIPKVGTVAKLMEKEAAPAQIFTFSADQTIKKNISGDKNKSSQGEKQFQDFGVLKVELESIQRVGKDEVVATLIFVNTQKRKGAIAVAHKEIQYSLAEGYRSFMGPHEAIANVIDNKGNRYKYVSSVGLGFGKNDNDWTFIKTGKKATVSITFKKKGEKSMGSVFKLNCAIYIAWKDQKDEETKMQLYNIFLRNK